MHNNGTNTPPPVDPPAVRRPPRGAAAASDIRQACWPLNSGRRTARSFSRSLQPRFPRDHPAARFFGYLHTFPRLVAERSAAPADGEGPPACWTPGRLRRSSSSLRSTCSARAWPATSRRSPRGLAAALLYIVLPASFETHVNLTNAHWHLALACALHGGGRTGRRRRPPRPSRRLGVPAVRPDRAIFNPLSAARCAAPAPGHHGHGAPRSQSEPCRAHRGRRGDPGRGSPLTSERVGAGASQFGAPAAPANC